MGQIIWESDDKQGRIELDDLFLYIYCGETRKFLKMKDDPTVGDIDKAKKIFYKMEMQNA
jgi:hypothetical protein